MTGPRGATLAIVQARMTSTRLPGKVLLPLAGIPMILRQVERISRASTLDGVVVATSDDPSDDALAGVVASAGYPVMRGSLDDVLARYLHVIDALEPDVVVRLTGDCPLTCPEIVDLVVERFHRSSADYMSNTLDPTFPDGLDVEVFTAATLHDLADETLDSDEREHVTLGIYRRPDRFHVENIVDPSGAENADFRWTVDDPADFEFVTQVFNHLYPMKPQFGYADVLNLLHAHPELSRTTKDSKRNAALDGINTGAMRH